MLPKKKPKPARIQVTLYIPYTGIIILRRAFFLLRFDHEDPDAVFGRFGFSGETWKKPYKTQHHFRQRSVRETVIAGYDP